MKTITLDYDLYKQELAAEFKKGAQRGIYEATEYVKNPGTYCLDKAVHYYERERLDECIAMRINCACDAYLDDLIGEEKLVVFVAAAKSLQSVTSHCQNGDAIQLNIGGE